MSRYGFFAYGYLLAGVTVILVGVTTGRDVAPGVGLVVTAVLFFIGLGIYALGRRNGRATSANTVPDRSPE